jgi:hypothetical protein
MVTENIAHALAALGVTNPSDRAELIALTADAWRSRHSRPQTYSEALARLRDACGDLGIPAEPLARLTVR